MPYRIILTSLLIGFFGVCSSSIYADELDPLVEIVMGNKRTKDLLGENKIEEALQNAHTTYEYSARELGADDPNTAHLAVTYARLLAATGSKGMARKVFKNTIEVYENNFGTDDKRLVSSLIGLAEVESAGRQKALVERALSIRKSQVPEDRLAYAETVLLAGEYLPNFEVNRDYAVTILTEALEIYESEYGKSSTEIIQPLMLLGNATARWGKPLRPKRYYKRALTIAKKKLSVEQHADLLQSTGKYLLQYSQSSHALQYLKEAHRAFKSLYGEDDLRTAIAALRVSQYYVAAGEPRKAEPLLKQLLDVLESDSNYRNQRLMALSLMVGVYEKLGASEKATPYCQAIGKITPWSDTQDYLPIYKKAPEYPRSAVSSGSEGYVIVEYTVDENGFVQSPSIVESTGSKSFHDVSIEAAKGFRYAPAYKNGEAVAMPRVRNKFSFSLR